MPRFKQTPEMEPISSRTRLKLGIPIKKPLHKRAIYTPSQLKYEQKDGSILYVVFPKSRAHIVLTIQSRGNQRVRFRIHSDQMAAACPAWFSLVFRPTGRRIKIDAPWHEEEAEYGLGVLLKSIHNKLCISQRLETVTARQLFYVAEAYQWLGKPQVLPPTIIEQTIDRLIKAAEALCAVEDWILLCSVANRFGLSNVLDEVRRAIVMCTGESDLIASYRENNDSNTAPFKLAAEQWRVVQKVMFKSSRIWLCRLTRLQKVFEGIELLVEQLVSINAGILPSEHKFIRWNQYQIVPCSECSPLSLDILCRALTAEGLWPLPKVIYYPGSVNSILARMKNVLQRIRHDRVESFEEAYDIDCDIVTCNPFLHMCDLFTRAVGHLESLFDDDEIEMELEDVARETTKTGIENFNNSEGMDRVEEPVGARAMGDDNTEDEIMENYLMQICTDV